MSYCDPAWISDYSFTSALFYRLNPGSASAFAGSSESLLVWGGLDEDGDPFLEPAFVVDAPSVLPAASGDYSLTGRTRGGEELFALSFDMQEVSDGGTPSFTFALPARCRLGRPSGGHHAVRARRVGESGRRERSLNDDPEGSPYGPGAGDPQGSVT